MGAECESWLKPTLPGTLQRTSVFNLNLSSRLYSRSRIGSHLPDMWHLADLKGSAPQTPRGGTLTVPLDPSADDVVGDTHD
jgi:hypothetical protein